MKVVGGTPHLLSNLEVLEHLQEVNPRPKQEDLYTIVTELTSYLQQRPAGNPGRPQTRENIAKFVAEIRSHKLALEKVEILQIINSAPTSMPVLFCLIEEADIRFTEDQLATILQLSEQYLGNEPLPGE